MYPLHSTVLLSNKIKCINLLLLHTTYVPCSAHCRAKHGRRVGLCCNILTQEGVEQ